jgi:hypothetical protein
MTDEQIIKALECCKIGNCDDCPFYGIKEDCDVELPEEALNIINRQKAEIERLQKENERWKNGFMGACMLENCKLKDEWKSEAIKEFAERLKKEALINSGYEVLQVGTIDNLVKEMTEVK